MKIKPRLGVDPSVPLLAFALKTPEEWANDIWIRRNSAMQPIVAHTFPAIWVDKTSPLRPTKLSPLGASVPELPASGRIAERLLALLNSSAVRKGSLEKMQFRRCRTDLLRAIDGCVRADKPVQQSALANEYRRWIHCMCGAGEWSGAMNAAIEMLRSSDWKYVERRLIANMRLEAAQLYWKNNRFLKSIFTAGHAVMTRPRLVGRPLKQLLKRLELL